MSLFASNSEDESFNGFSKADSAKCTMKTKPTLEPNPCKGPGKGPGKNKKGKAPLKRKTMTETDKPGPSGSKQSRIGVKSFMHSTIY